MKLLIITNSSDGLYEFRKDLLKKIVEKKNEIYVLTPFNHYINLLEDLGVKLIETSLDRRSKNFIKDFNLILNYYIVIRKIQPDMIITYTIKPNIYGGILSRILNIPFAANITGLGSTFQEDNILKRIVSFLYKISLKQAKVVFFENDENKKVFLNSKIVSKDIAIRLNGAGVNLNDFPLKPYKKNKEKINFLFIGRVMKEKGIDEFLYVAEKIKKENVNVEFNIVGPMEDDYTDLINEFQEKEIINYYGFQKDVRPFIESCHCFVLPSYHEGMANTLLEAGAMGRPLITSNIYGCKEAVNKNGYLVNVRDRDDLYRVIKKFIALSYDEKKQMGIQSRNHISQVFDKKKVVQETIKGLKL